MAANTFSIRDAAEASGLNAKTIRYYEQIGLIPQARRGNRAARTGGNRIYHEVDIERLRFVRNARLLGLGLADIHDLLTAADGGCPGDQPLYHETLAEHLKAIDDRIAHLHALRGAVENLMSRQRGAGGCTRAGCGCMDAPELSSASATSVVERTNGSALAGQPNGKGSAP